MCGFIGRREIVKNKLCVTWGSLGLLIGAAVLPSFKEYVLVIVGGFMVLTSVFWKINDIHEECRALVDRRREGRSD